jgi:Zn-dependent oligopeptidase
MNHKQYAKKLFSHVLSKGYAIKCYSDDWDRICSTDIINQEVEAGFIEIYSKVNKKYLGCINWIGCNDWDESISDYTLELDDILGLDNFISINS